MPTRNWHYPKNKDFAFAFAFVVASKRDSMEPLKDQLLPWGGEFFVPPPPLTIDRKTQDLYKTKTGGFTRAQLARWGVNWPPKKGWRHKLAHGKNPN